MFMVSIPLFLFVQFGLSLDLSEYTTDGIQVERTTSVTPKKCHYELVGVVVHSGSADFGHYYSIIQTKEWVQQIVA